jgi:hypothetical protein
MAKGKKGKRTLPAVEEELLDNATPLQKTHTTTRKAATVNEKQPLSSVPARPSWKAKQVALEQAGM